MKKNNLSLFPFGKRTLPRGVFVMKHLLLFLCVFTFQLNVFSQKTVSLKLENADVKSLIKEIESQTELGFLYSIREVEKVKKGISIHKENISVEEALSIGLKDTGLSFELIDNIIVIEPESQAANKQARIEVIGKVTDEDGLPLPGATILEEGTLNGITTDAEGNYSLKVRSTKSVLRISFVGFETQRIEVGNKTVIDVKMKESTTDLDEVVVTTGYLAIPEVRSTGSTANLSEADIKESGAVSIDQVFRGKMAGALAMNVSGRPGASTRIRIRGLNSITGNMEPIWIVDGMEMKEAVPNISVGGVNLQNSILTNGIGAIAPEDIASITVLKDAAASALYGARAANGVIVVTTKKGNAGENRINISSSFSLSEAPTNRYEMMNTAEKIQYERDLFEDAPYHGTTGRVAKMLNLRFRGLISPEEVETQIAELQKVNTDWFDVIFRPAYSWRHSISMSGGTKRMQYYTSANLSEEQGILEGNQLNAFNATAKMTMLPLSKLRIEPQLRMSIRKDVIPNPVQDPFEYATFANPYEKPYNEDGSYAYDRSRLVYKDFYQADDDDKYWDYNILEDMATSTRKNNTSSITFDGRISYDVLKSLSLESQLQYTYSSSYGREWADPGSYASHERGILHNSGMREVPDDLNKGYLRETHGDSESYTFKNLIKYNTSIKDKHFINVLLGQEASKTDAGNFFNLLPEYDPFFKIGSYPGELDPDHFNSATNDEITFDTYNFELLGNTGISETRTASFFMNGSYSYQDMYILNASIRYDGVDIIGNKNNFTPLWNISGKWNMHREEFIQDIDFIDVLSLRVSVGYTGSIDRNALPFTFLNFTLSQFYDGAMLPNSINWRNPNVKWQRKYDRNIGLNASLFKNRFNFEFNYYNNKVVDLLDDKQLPYSSGSSTIKANVASVTNKGFELTVNTVLLENNDWRWTLNFNISKNANEITETFYKNVNELPVIDSEWPVAFPSKYYTVGYDVSAVFGYEFAGVDPMTGNTLIYVTNEEHLNDWEVHSEKNGRKIIDMDRYFNHEATIAYLGKTEPDMYGGFGTTLSYKAFTLAAQFTYVSGNIIVSPSTTEPYAASGNLLRNTANRWRQPGDLTEIPEIVKRGHTVGGTNAYSEYFFSSNMEKGDFLKLTYVNLSYDLPRKFIKKLGMQRCRFSINANNLFTWTKYKGIDPENNGLFGYPSSRKYTASLEITF